MMPTIRIGFTKAGRAGSHLGRFSRRIVWLLGLIFSAIVLAGPQEVEEDSGTAATSGLLAGVARADITPAVGIPHMNWGSATHLTAEGLDPVGLKATALVLSHGPQQFAFVDIDVGAVDRMGGKDMVAEIIKRAAAATGIPEGHISLHASHTHAAPALATGKGPAGASLEPMQAIMDRHWHVVADKVVGAVQEAHASLQPVHMHGGRGLGTIGVNRRYRSTQPGGRAAVGLNPEGFTDRELVVFRIDDAAGRPLAVLINFQAHPTVLAYRNRLVSPDWPGMMRQVVERALPGATAVFFQGAAGNLGPVEGFTGDLRVAHRLGAIVGHQAAAVALQIETAQRAPVFEGYVESMALQARQHWRVKGPRDQTIRFVRQEIEVPRRTYEPGEIARLVAWRDEAAELAGAFHAGDQSWEALQARARLRRNASLLESWQGPANPKSLVIELRALRIGELAIVAMPGEPFAEIGDAVKRASPFAFTIFAGYANGKGGGYLPTTEEYPEGGYEVEISPYGKGADIAVIKAASAMLQALRR